MLNRVRNRLDSHGREILSKGLVTFILKIVGAGAGFLFQFVIARQLGASGSGAYFLSLNTLLLLSTATRLGMDNSVTRFVAAGAVERDWGAVRGVARSAILIAAGISFFSSLVFAIFTEPLVLFFGKPELMTSMRGMLLLTAPLALMTLYAKAIQGLKMAHNTMLMQGVLVPVVGGVCAWFLSPRFGIAGAVGAYATGVVTTLCYGAWTWHKAMRPHREEPARFDRKTLLTASFPLMGAALLQQVSSSLPLLVLGYWGSTADAGMFGAAQRTATLVSLVLVAANIIVAPKLAELYQKQDFDGLGRVARQGAVFMTVMASPVLALCLLVPGKIMGLFGDEFASGSALLVVMALGQLVNVMTGSVSFMLVMTGNEKSFFKANLLSTILCAVLAVALTPTYGAMGAAIAVALPLAVVNLARVRFIWQQLGVMVLPIPWKR